MKFIDKLIFQETKPFRLRLLFVLFLMLLTVFFEALSPWPFKLLIDNVLDGVSNGSDPIANIIISILKTPYAMGIFVVFMYFAINMLLSFFEYIRSSVMKSVMREIIDDFSHAAFHGLEKFSIGFYRKQAIGDFIYRLSYDTSALGEYLEDGILPIITSSLYLIVTAAIMFFINVKLTILSLVVLPFLTMGLYFFNKRIDSAANISERWSSAVFSYVEQALGQLRIVQAFQQEKNISQKYNSLVRTSLKSDLEMYKLDYLLNLLVGFAIAGIYTIIIANGITDVRNGLITTGLLIVFIFYLDNLTSPVLEIIFATSIIKQSYIRISRMHEFFNKDNYLKAAGTLQFLDNYTITFKNVSVLTDNNKHILRDVSFTIPEESFAVIVGPSGSGKSTITSLLPRLINDPKHGTILIGDHVIADYDLSALRENISFVPQDVLLFNDTIYNNIVFGHNEATKEEVLEAAKLACAHDFIVQHEKGYEFRVGEEGNYLSGGERQRILLARAFLKPARIVILDEPFSYLDLETRTKVWNNLKKFGKGKTIIMVTNIIDVMESADIIILTDKGEIKKILTKGKLGKKKLITTLI